MDNKSMPAFIDLSSKAFGSIYILGRRGSDKHGKPVWFYRCACGNEKEISGNAIRGGQTNCGCGRKSKGTNIKHGQTRDRNPTPEYNSWAAAKSRCFNPNNIEFKRWYGARGVTMCEQWKNSFEEFLKYMGPKPTPQHSIDRYPNLNGNYEPGNCRWADKKEQACNRRKRQTPAVS